LKTFFHRSLQSRNCSVTFISQMLARFSGGMSKTRR
jgi:hypothetical protein